MNETVLYGMGEFHLRVLLERMGERYGVHVKTHPPSIPYRETITRPAEGHCRHKKQAGGAGQFGEVFLRIEALGRGTGFEFVDDVVGGAIPGQYIPAVEKGVRPGAHRRRAGRFPIQDVRVTVYDGKHHAVDSKEVAFVSAGRKAFLDALQKATPIVLEPIMRLEITAPASAIGDITGDLATKRARINRQQLPARPARHAHGVRAARGSFRIPVAPEGTHRRPGRLHHGAQPLRSGAAAQAARTRPGVASAGRGGVRPPPQLCRTHPLS